MKSSALAFGTLLLAASFAQSETRLGEQARIEVILRANRGTTSGHERTERAKFCLTNVFLPGEFGDNDDIWLEVMTSSGSSFLPFAQGTKWWRLDESHSLIEFRFEDGSQRERVTFSFEPRSLKFRSVLIFNSRTPDSGLTCGF